VDFNWNVLFSLVAGVISFFLWLIPYKKFVKLPLAFSQRFNIFFIIVIVGYIGSRLASITETWLLNSQFDYSFIGIIKHGGHRIYGPIFFIGSITLIGYFLSNRIIIIQMLDVVAVIFCVSIAIGIWGCQISGHGCYGIPTSLPWGMDYSWGSKPANCNVHPTPIYDSLFYVVLFVFLNFQIRGKHFVGKIFSLFLILSGGYNFLKEFIRANNHWISIFNVSHLFYSVFFLLGIFCYFFFRRKELIGQNL